METVIIKNLITIDKRKTIEKQINYKTTKKK